MKPKQLKNHLAKIEKLKSEIASRRDKLRELISDVETFLEDCDEGIEQIEEGLRLIEEGADSLSRMV